MKTPSSESRVVPYGQTDRRADMTKLIVAFQNFANAPKSRQYTHTFLQNAWGVLHKKYARACYAHIYYLNIYITQKNEEQANPPFRHWDICPSHALRVWFARRRNQSSVLAHSSSTRLPSVAAVCIRYCHVAQEQKKKVLYSLEFRQ
jgi:hypothetical protein